MNLTFILCDFCAIFAASFEDLKTLLLKDEENGSRLAIIFAQIALFIAMIFVWNTKLCAERDSTGFITALSYQIMAVLVSNSRRLIPLSCLTFIHRHCGFKVNLAANFIGFMLTFFSEKFYEKSWSSLGFALSITVLFLILLVIIRPSTDLGLFSLLIGVIGSVAYNRFGLKFQSWIVGAICLPPFAFRLWLENNWLEVRNDQSPTPDGSTGGTKQICKSETIEETIEQLAVGLFHLFWVYNLFITNRQSCTSSSIIMGVPACLLIFNLWFGIALIPRLHCFFKTGPAAPPRREDRRVPESDLEALSRREERTDPEALSRREERTDPESLSRWEEERADPESLSRWEERKDPESLSRRGENRRTEAGASGFNVGPGAGAFHVGEAAVSITLGPGAGGRNSGPASGSMNLFSGPINFSADPGGISLDPGAGGLRRRIQVNKEGATKISAGDLVPGLDAGSGGLGSDAIKRGQGSGGLRKRAQVDKEDLPADVAM